MQMTKDAAIQMLKAAKWDKLSTEQLIKIFEDYCQMAISNENRTIKELVRQSSKKTYNF
jgi:hypothetical protein